MKVLISGQAGKAAIFHGNEASVIDVYNPEEEMIHQKTTVPYYFADANDIEVLDLNTKQDVKEKLKLFWERSLALQLFLIFLDPEEETKTRLIAGEDLCPYFENSEIIEYVSNILFSSPFPKNFELNFEKISLENFPAVFSFINTLNHSQEAISVVRKNWDYLPLDIFKGDVRRKQEFEKQAIALGIFKEFSRAYSDSVKFGIARYDSQMALNSLENSRQIISNWTAGFKPDTSEFNVDIEVDEKDQRPEFIEDTFDKKAKYHWEETKFSIDKQKTSIKECLKGGDLSKARKYVEDLIQFQSQRSDPQHLAKSLCHLSKLARDICSYSMQLEWAQRAYEFDPGDSKVHTHIGDAYICLCKYAEAIKWLRSGAVRGEEAYELSGLARVYRGQGAFEKALQTYEEVCERFPDSEIGWLGKAEVLRDMWKLEESLAVYKDACEKFPGGDNIPRNGQASVLKELGQLELAEKLFGDVIEESGNDYSYAGKAGVLREKRKFKEALDLYSLGIKKFPDSHILHNGFASVLREKGDLKEALKYYGQVHSQFPFDSVSWSGKAEVLREMGNSDKTKLDEALDLYSQGIGKFPHDPVMFSGKANILKRLFRYEESLRAYDQGVIKFPYNLYMLSGRADLLKELGHLEEAIEAYEKVEEVSPRVKSVPHAKAAIYVAMKKFDEAEELISLKEYQTYDDWIAFHIKCMILLKTKKYKEAKDELEFGLEFNPFEGQRKYFQNSLMIVNLYEGNLDEAGKYIVEDSAPLTNILRMHYFCETKQLVEAKKAYSSVADSCTPVLSLLRDELGVRYNISPGKAKYSKEWVFEQECQNILLKAA